VRQAPLNTYTFVAQKTSLNARLKDKLELVYEGDSIGIPETEKEKSSKKATEKAQATDYT